MQLTERRERVYGALTERRARVIGTLTERRARVFGGAVPPDDTEGGGPNVWRQQRGTVRMALRMGARTRLRLRAGAVVRLSYALTGATRRRIGDDLWLLGLGSDEDMLLFGATKAAVKKDAVDRLLDSVDAEARTWAEEATKDGK